MHTILIDNEFEQTFPLETWIDTALRAQQVNVACEISVLITDENGIQEINRDMREIDAVTDVLSFPMFPLVPGTPPDESLCEQETNLVPLGDIVLCLPRAAQQAQEYGHSLSRELAYLTVHSVLHLLGYDHLDEGPEKKIMREREKEIMREITL